MNKSLEMKTLIEEAYQLFVHPLGANLTDVCTECCVSEEDEKLLIKTPVKNLSKELIYQYLDAAFSTQDGKEIVHFLPRVLELLAEDEEIRHSTEITLDKCHFSKSHWSEKQLDFMHRFSVELIKNLLKTPPENCLDVVDSYIVMFDLAELPTAHLLTLWEEMAQEYPTAVEHFEKMMYYEVKSLEYYNKIFAEEPFREQMNQWINNPKTAQKFSQAIEKHYFNNSITDEEMKQRWEILFSILEQKAKS